MYKIEIISIIILILYSTDVADGCAGHRYPIHSVEYKNVSWTAMLKKEYAKRMTSKNHWKWQKLFLYQPICINK